MITLASELARIEMEDFAEARRARQEGVKLVGFNEDTIADKADENGELVSRKVTKADEDLLGDHRNDADDFADDYDDLSDDDDDDDDGTKVRDMFDTLRENGAF